MSCRSYAEISDGNLFLGVLPGSVGSIIPDLSLRGIVSRAETVTHDYNET